jgi:hypothetical protein
VIVSARPAPATTTPPRSAVVWLVAGIAALAVLAAAGASLIAFWPGLLDVHAIDEWGQMLAPRLSPYHPPVHTVALWVLHRLWPSPAGAAVVQAAALALLVFAIARACLAAGAPIPLGLATAVAFAATPAVGLASIALWHEVPYAIALLGLVLVCWHAAVTRGAALRRPLTLAGLAIALAAIALAHQQGAIVAAILGVWIVVAAGRGRWPYALAAAIVSLTMVAAGNALPRKLLRLEPTPDLFRARTPLHQVAALVASGVALDPADRALFVSIATPETWTRLYDCRSVLPLMPGLDQPALLGHVPAFRAAWRHSAASHPLVTLGHIQCVGGFAWNPLAAPLTFVPLAIADNSFGLATTPRSAPVHRAYTALIRVTTGHALARALFWGPALHFWIVVICALIAGRRLGHWGWWPFLPAIVHTLAIVPLIASADYRVQFPVVPIGLLSPLLLASLLRTKP